jgi:hypothetical protein
MAARDYREYGSVWTDCFVNTPHFWEATKASSLPGRARCCALHIRRSKLRSYRSMGPTRKAVPRTTRDPTTIRVHIFGLRAEIFFARPRFLDTVKGWSVGGGALPYVHSVAHGEGRTAPRMVGAQAQAMVGPGIQHVVGEPVRRSWRASGALARSHGFTTNSRFKLSVGSTDLALNFSEIAIDAADPLHAEHRCQCCVPFMRALRRRRKAITPTSRPSQADEP